MFEVRLDEIEAAVDHLAATGLPVAGAAMVRVRRAVARLEALVCAAQVRFDEAEIWRDEGATSLRGWLTDAVGLGRRGAAASARRSERLESWPAVLDAWIAGDLSGAQVDVMVDVVPRRFVAAFAAAAPGVVDVVAPLDPMATEAALRQWVRCAENDDGADDLSVPPSGVFVSTYGDGRLALSGDLAPDEGAIVEAALRVFDVPDPVDESGDPIGERRSMARRNADALVAMARFALDHRDGGGDAGRFLPHVSLIVGASELRAAVLRGAGARSVDDVRRCATERGWSPVDTTLFVDALARHGAGVTSEGQPLDATALASLSCDSVVQRVLFNGTKVLELGREERTATHWQRKAVVARDRHCRAPGCRARARFCEVHHLDHWIDGGRTDVSRMVLLCGTHHRQFHRPGFRMELDDDARLTVHAPNGWTRTSVVDRLEQTVFPLPIGVP